MIHQSNRRYLYQDHFEVLIIPHLKVLGQVPTGRAKHSPMDPKIENLH